MKIINFIILFLILCPITYADILYLKDGKTIEGNIIGETKNDIMIESKYGTTVVEREDINRIEKEKLQVNRDRILYRDSTNLIKLGKEYINKNKYLLAIETFKKAGGMLKEISGETKYTDIKQKAVLEIEGNLNKINKELEEKKLVIYKDKIISKDKMDEINKHLEAGEIFFNKKAWIKPKQLCDKCNHTGKVQCDVCNSTGEVALKCTSCEKGYVICSTCNGSGSITCLNCNGKGEQIGKCSNCKGVGTIRCGFCRGRGEQYRSCEVCRGTGRIRQHKGEYVHEMSCGGCKNGRVIEPCSGCRGQGNIVCSKCNGKGEYWKGCKTCNGSGTVTCPKNTKCTKCKGKTIFYSKCTQCKGKRKKECKECKGLGYISEDNVGVKINN